MQCFHSFIHSKKEFLLHSYSVPDTPPFALRSETARANTLCWPTAFLLLSVSIGPAHLSSLSSISAASEPAPASGALLFFSRSSHRSWSSWEGPGQGLGWSPGPWKILGTFPFPFHHHHPAPNTWIPHTLSLLGWPSFPLGSDLSLKQWLAYTVFIQRPVPWDMNVKWLFLMMPQKACRIHLYSLSSMPRPWIYKIADSHLSNSWAMRRGKLSGLHGGWVYDLGLILRAWQHGVK